MEPANKILGITYSIKGTGNIDKKKAYVVVCNHQSSVDVLTTMQVIQSFKLGLFFGRFLHINISIRW